MGANPGLLTLDCHKNHGGHHDLGEEEEWKKNTSMEATDGRLVRGTFPRRDIEYNSINKINEQHQIKSNLTYLPMIRHS
jgi:hypothetical protein